MSLSQEGSRNEVIMRTLVRVGMCWWKTKIYLSREDSMH